MATTGLAGSAASAGSAILAAPHGPKPHFLRGNLPEYSRDRLNFLEQCARTYGDFVPLKFGPRQAYLLNHPDLIEYVVVTNQRNFIKHIGLRLNRQLFGNGLLLAEGDFWLRQRRLAQPAFHRQRVASYGSIMVEYTQRMLDQWRDGEERDLHTEMMRVTLQIVAQTLFSADVAANAPEIGRAMKVVMDTFNARLESVIILPESIPTPLMLRLKRAIRDLDRVVYKLIKERHADATDHQDLLGLLMAARDEDDASRMSDKQLRDEVMTLFAAGHETTAIALSWTWYMLARNPEAEQKLHAEIDKVLGGRAPGVADLPNLPYTERVVLETMRLYPPAWIFGREAVADCEIGGYPVRRGAMVLMSQWVTQRDARWFDDPLSFNPDRWSDNAAKRLPKYAYFPFGGGPRLCIGNSFAMMEAILLIATIAQKFRFTIDPAYKVVPHPSITLRPSAVPATLHQRSR